MSRPKLFSYFILLAIALLLPINSFAYEYDKREGKWVMRAKIGGSLFDKDRSVTRNGVAIEDQIDGNIFNNGFYAELEGDYFLHDRLSIGTFAGYMPLNRGETWTVGSISDSGKITTMPVAAMVKFHIAPYGEIRPYVGLGYYYAFTNSTYSLVDVDVSTSGAVFSGGLDWWFDRDWALNLEVKEFLMSVDADFAKLYHASGDNSVDSYIAKSEANPIALTIGITHRF